MDESPTPELSLTTWLQQKKLNQYEQQLSDNAITCLEDLLVANEDDLREIIQACGMALGHRLKFIRFVRELQQEHPNQPPTAPTTNFFVIGQEEQESIRNLTKRVSEIQQAVQAVESRIQEVTGNHERTMGELTSSFDAIARAVETRRNELTQECEKIFNTKMEALHRQLDELNSGMKKGTDARKACETQLRGGSMMDISNEANRVLELVNTSLSELTEMETDPNTNAVIEFFGATDDVVQVISRYGIVGGASGISNQPGSATVSDLNYGFSINFFTATEEQIQNNQWNPCQFDQEGDEKTGNECSSIDITRDKMFLRCDVIYDKYESLVIASKMMTCERHVLVGTADLDWMNPVRMYLCESLGKPSVQLNLLCQSSRDGLEHTKFHQLCDNKGPTVVFIQDEFGNVFGGFNSNSWTSPSTWTYQASTQGFLFLLHSVQGKDAPRKFQVIRNQYATYDHQSYGPYFGHNGDLHVNTNKKVYCNASRSNSYGFTDDTMFSNKKACQITEMEVYSVV